MCPQARSQGMAWGGNAALGARYCRLFAIPKNFVSSFLMEFFFVLITTHVELKIMPWSSKKLSLQSKNITVVRAFQNRKLCEQEILWKIFYGIDTQWNNQWSATFSEEGPLFPSTLLILSEATVISSVSVFVSTNSSHGLPPPL